MSMCYDIDLKAEDIKASHARLLKAVKAERKAKGAYDERPSQATMHKMFAASVELTEAVKAAEELIA